MWQNGEGMTDTNEFIQTLEGELTPEQVDQLIHGPEGDTEAESEETGGEPETTTETDASEQDSGTEDAVSRQSETEIELSAENAVVMARDNKHTIPFEKLEEAREGQKHWRAQAEAAQQELEALKAQAQARADAGIAPTRTDELVEQAAEAIEQGADISLFGDFSEEDLAGGIDKRFDQKSAPLLERIAQLEATLKQTLAVDAHSAHLNAIYAAHPDADSVVQSQELTEWINSQPTFVRGSMNAVIEKGSTDEVIELFSAFKSATGTTQAAGNLTADAVKAAAKQKAANAKSDAPASLSDFPAGRAGATSRDEAMHDMNSGIELSEAMREMTEEQIEQFLNRL